MNFILHPWQLLLVILAGWINRQQQDVIEYLRTDTHQPGTASFWKRSRGAKAWSCSPVTAWKSSAAGTRKSATDGSADSSRGMRRAPGAPPNALGNLLFPTSVVNTYARSQHARKRGGGGDRRALRTCDCRPEKASSLTKASWLGRQRSHSLGGRRS